MQQFNIKSILFNGAAALVVLSTVVFMIRSLFVTEQVTACTTRYAKPTEFTLDNGDNPMSTVQLVGAIGGSQRGIYRNAKVVRVRGAPSEHALKVSLRPDSEDTRKSGDGNGVGFEWSPTGMAGAASACLSYSVYLPRNLEFGAGGVLPGFYAGQPITMNEAGDGRTAAAHRLVWRTNGRANIYAQLPGYDANGGSYLDTEGFEFPKGRWFTVEQELVLNTPGKRDGIARVFIDGELQLEKTAIEWRKTGKLPLTGVLAEPAYAMPRREILPPKETAIFVSGLQVRWQ